MGERKCKELMVDDSKTQGLLLKLRFRKSDNAMK